MRGAVAALLAVAGALAADPARADDQVATCSWPLKTTVDTLNVAFPDASATYWTTPFTVLPNLSEIILDGTYADARYLSVNVYNNAGSSFDCGGRESGLADFATTSPSSGRPMVRPAASSPTPTTSMSAPWCGPGPAGWWWCARAASFPPGTHPAPWPAGADLRYWSLCVNVYRRPWPVVTVNDGGRQIVGCTADLDTPQDEAGFYTYVVSRLPACGTGRPRACWNATMRPGCRSPATNRRHGTC